MKDIVLSGVSKAYGENLVLNKLSATFEYGKVNAIMSASGVGKTTLLRVMCGLEKMDSGEISGLDVKKIAVVFQEDRLCENLNALANIKFVTNKSEPQILSALAKIGLSEFEYFPVNKLSGGMKRRVAILRALLSEYDILFLDEPFKGLDVDTKLSVMEYTKEMIKGKTVILITHDEEEAEFLQANNMLKLCKDNES